MMRIVSVIAVHNDAVLLKWEDIMCKTIAVDQKGLWYLKTDDGDAVCLSSLTLSDVGCFYSYDTMDNADNRYTQHTGAITLTFIQEG